MIIERMKETRPGETICLSYDECEEVLGLLNVLDSALGFLAESGIDIACDENVCDDGWCDERCQKNGITKECWIRYFSKMRKSGEKNE